MAELNEDRLDATPGDAPEETSSAPEVERSADIKTLNKRRAARLVVQEDVPPEATARATPHRLAVALERARIAARIADDNRATDILVLDLRKATPLIDYFVIATAASRRQASAISSEIDAEMKKIGEKKLGIEGEEEGRWILIDYGDFIVHIFSEEARTYYALEELWGDADRLEWEAPRPGAPSPVAPAANP